VSEDDNLTPSCAVVTKCGNLNFLEPSGPPRAWNGTDLPLYVKAVVGGGDLHLKKTLPYVCFL